MKKFSEVLFEINSRGYTLPPMPSRITPANLTEAANMSKGSRTEEFRSKISAHTDEIAKHLKDHGVRVTHVSHPDPAGTFDGSHSGYVGYHTDDHHKAVAALHKLPGYKHHDFTAEKATGEKDSHRFRTTGEHHTHKMQLNASHMTTAKIPSNNTGGVSVHYIRAGKFAGGEDHDQTTMGKAERHSKPPKQ